MRSTYRLFKIAVHTSLGSIETTRNICKAITESEYCKGIKINAITDDGPRATNQGEVKLKENELNGNKIAYHSETLFLIQLGKGSKGSYKTTQTIKGNLNRAVMIYTMLNIGNGYKKRLLAPSFNKPLLARHFS